MEKRQTKNTIKRAVVRLPEMMPKLDILDFASTNMVGDLGELIARYYLIRQWHVFNVYPGLWYPNLPLTDEQKDYLEHLSPKWDLMGCPRGETWLVEVKTSRPGRSKHGLKNDRRKNCTTPGDLREMSRLGFHMLLVNVELQENWRCTITAKELLADSPD